MAVEYGQGKVNIAPDEKTKLIPKERIRRTKSEFFSHAVVRGLILAEIVYKILKSVISKCDFQKLQNSVDYDPQDFVVFLAVAIIIIFVPLGLVALAVALRAHNDNKIGNYAGAKRKRRLVYAIGVLAILVDCLIVVFAIVTTRN